MAKEEGKEMLKGGGRYLMVSTLTGTVMSSFELAHGSKRDAVIAFDVPEGAMVLEDPGVAMARGRRVADIREIGQADKDRVAEAVAANSKSNENRSKSIAADLDAAKTKEAEAEIKELDQKKS